MKFYLDGYNVIGQANHISLTDSNKIERFIEWLKKYLKKGDQLVIIFDGKNKFVDFPTTQKLPGMTIIHTPASQSADDYIKDKVLTKKDTSNIVVVSSDRDILFHAKKAKVKAMRSADFLSWFCHESMGSTGKKSPNITNEHIEYWLDAFNQES